MIRKSCFTVAALFSIVTVTLLNGCGSGNKEGTAAVFTRVSEATCAQCHGSAVSAVTAQPIYGGWQRSSHFLKAVNPNDPNAGADQTVAADCQRCHGGGSAHNGIGPIQFPQPDVAGICSQCHNADTFAATAPQHVTSVTFVDENGNRVTSATYMDSVSKCTNCHDPHDTTLTARFGNSLNGVDPDTGMVGLYADWAGSGHGDPQALPWTDENFGSLAVCARCHSASGYKLYLANPLAKSWAWKTGAAASDPNKEMLRCDGCHINYAFVRRNGATNGADAALIPYAIPSGALSGNVLSNAGDSNLCVNCHSGRASGTAIMTVKFANLSSTFGTYNSHYLAAGGILYNIIGFEGYSTAYTHTRYTPVGFLHDRIGLDSGFNLGVDRGPCVGCHYTDPVSGANFSHTLKAFVGTTGLTGVVTAPSVACANCHIDGTSLQLQAADLNTLKAQYKAGLDAITTLLRTRYGIFFTGGVEPYPYFFTDAAFTHSKIRWDAKALAGGDTRSADTAGRRLAGSAFILNLLTREPGGYAHNQQYSMTMIYDAIDYLEDGKVGGVLNGTVDVPLTTLQFIFSVPVDGVTPVNARPIS
jgi:hypothetical protein